MKIHGNYAELSALEERVARAKNAKKAKGRTVKAVSANIARRMKIGGGDVVDALKPLDIRITADDVRRGAQKNATSCAAARALCREGFTEARVHAARTYVKQPDGKWLRYFTGDGLRSEIVAFDRGGAFEPGEYRLAPIQPSERIGTRAKRAGGITGKRKGHKPGRPPGAPRKNHITTGIRQRFNSAE